jgi:hypothetical protein
MAGAEAPGMADDDYFSGEYLQDILESDLLELGGQQLLDEAHDEAGAYVDQHFPWDGRGDEPAERVRPTAACVAAR